VKVALFSHNFLEPTHHAIASVLNELQGHSFSVFAKRFYHQRSFQLSNVVAYCDYKRDIEINLRPFDLVHIIYDGDIAFQAAELASTTRIPFILSFHGGFDTKCKIYDPRFTARTRRIAELARVVTVTSKTDVTRLQFLEIQASITVVPVPVDFRVLPQAGKRRETKLISIGRLIEKKGIDVALKALATLPPQYTLDVIGEGVLEKSLCALSQSLGLVRRVDWLGLCTLEKTLQTLNECGVMVHAAKPGSDGNSEGTPQVILWAQAMGVPVVSTYSGDVPDIVEHNETGLLVAPDDPLAIAKAVMKLADDFGLRHKIILEARRRVTNVHGLTEISALWQKIYWQAARSI
jgi:glycosyltransferase involved in cell wall biosynthesis